MGTFLPVSDDNPLSAGYRSSHDYNMKKYLYLEIVTFCLFQSNIAVHFSKNLVYIFQFYPWKETDGRNEVFQRHVIHWDFRLGFN